MRGFGPRMSINSYDSGGVILSRPIQALSQRGSNRYLQMLSLVSADVGLYWKHQQPIGRKVGAKQAMTSRQEQSWLATVSCKVVCFSHCFLALSKQVEVTWPTKVYQVPWVKTREGQLFSGTGEADGKAKNAR